MRSIRTLRDNLMHSATAVVSKHGPNTHLLLGTWNQTRTVCVRILPTKARASVTACATQNQPMENVVPVSTCNTGVFMRTCRSHRHRTFTGRHCDVTNGNERRKRVVTERCCRGIWSRSRRLSTKSINHTANIDFDDFH